MIRRPPRSTQSRSSAASDVYKRQLLVDTVKMLHPAAYLGFDLVLLELVGYMIFHLLHELFPLDAALGDHLLDLLVALRVQGLHGEVLEPPLDLRDAEPVGKRGVYLKRLGRYLALPVGRQRGYGLH